MERQSFNPSEMNAESPQLVPENNHSETLHQDSTNAEDSPGAKNNPRKFGRRGFLKTLLGAGAAAAVAPGIKDISQDMWNSGYKTSERIYKEGETIETPFGKLKVQGWNLVLTKEEFLKAGGKSFILETKLPDYTGDITGEKKEGSSKIDSDATVHAFRQRLDASEGDIVVGLMPRQYNERPTAEISIVSERQGFYGGRVREMPKTTYEINLESHVYKHEYQSGHGTGQSYIISEVSIPQPQLASLYATVGKFAPHMRIPNHNTNVIYIKRHVNIDRINAHVSGKSTSAHVDDKGRYVSGRDDFAITLDAAFFTDPKKEKLSRIEADHECAHGVFNKGLGERKKDLVNNQYNFLKTSVGQRELLLYAKNNGYINSQGFPHTWDVQRAYFELHKDPEAGKKWNSSVFEKEQKLFMLFTESEYIKTDREANTVYQTDGKTLLGEHMGHPIDNYNEYFASITTIFKNYFPEFKRRLVDMEHTDPQNASVAKIAARGTLLVWWGELRGNNGYSKMETVFPQAREIMEFLGITQEIQKEYEEFMMGHSYNLDYDSKSLGLDTLVP